METSVIPEPIYNRGVNFKFYMFYFKDFQGVAQTMNCSKHQITGICSFVQDNDTQKITHLCTYTHIYIRVTQIQLVVMASCPFLMVCQRIIKQNQLLFHSFQIPYNTFGILKQFRKAHCNNTTEGCDSISHLLHLVIMKGKLTNLCT